MVEYDIIDDSDFIVDYVVADAIYNMLKDADFMNWGPDPPILLIARATYSIYKDRDKKHEWIFTRNPDEEYETAEDWIDVGARHRMEGRDVHVSAFFEKPDKHRVGWTQITSQVYSNSGGMMTFDLKQSLGEDPQAFIRIPVHRAYSEESKQGPWPGDFRQFHWQSRPFSSQFGDTPSAHEDYFHPHYKTGGDVDRDDIIEMFEQLLELVEKSETRWG